MPRPKGGLPIFLGMFAGRNGTQLVARKEDFGMLRKTELTRVQKAVEKLRGIVAGIASDYELSNGEVAKLTEWLSVNADLSDRSPFKDLNALLKDALRDQVLDEDERADILLWCQDFSDSQSWPIANATEGVQRLHGFLQGIASDGLITAKEVHDLADWLHDYESIRSSWPFDDVWAFVDRIRADGKITDEERRELQIYCEGFAEVLVSESHVKEDRQSAHFKTSAPFVLSIDTIFSANASVDFPGKSFCFTGNFAFGPKRTLAEMVNVLGGEIKKSVTQDLHYLIVGTIGEPTWAYSVYGRKIEAVHNNLKKGSTTLIIREDDFLSAARKQLG